MSLEKWMVAPRHQGSMSGAVSRVSQVCHLVNIGVFFRFGRRRSAGALPQCYLDDITYGLNARQRSEIALLVALTNNRSRLTGFGKRLATRLLAFTMITRMPAAACSFQTSMAGGVLSISDIDLGRNNRLASDGSRIPCRRGPLGGILGPARGIPRKLNGLSIEYGL